MAIGSVDVVTAALSIVIGRYMRIQAKIRLMKK